LLDDIKSALLILVTMPMSFTGNVSQNIDACVLVFKILS